MFSTSDLQALIEKIDGGQQGVDLVKIGQNLTQQSKKNVKKIDKSQLIHELDCIDSASKESTSNACCTGHRRMFRSILWRLLFG